MNLENQEKELRNKNFEETLKKNGIKVTRQRLEIYQVAAGTATHPDAAEIYLKVRRKYPLISLDTVYRNLWLFRDLGLISVLGAERGRHRFDANRAPHHHFSCQRCGTIEDFDNPEYDSMPLPENVSKMGTISDLQVELKGLCNKCLTGNDKGKKRR